MKGRVLGRTVSAVEVTGASPHLPVTETRVFSAAGMTAHQVRIDTKTGLDFQWRGQSHYLALHDMQNLDSETFLDSQPVDRRRDLRGRLTFVAAGCRVWGWGIPEVSPRSFTALYLDPAQMEVEVARKLKNLPDKSELYFKHSALRTTLEKLQQALTSEITADSMYLESVCLTAMLELCSYRQEAGVDATNPGSRLARSLEMRLSEYVESHLGQDIGLDDLARLAGLSRFHFLRAFKRTIGQTPYQYLLGRRVAAAQKLLKTSALSQAEIAEVVGFKESTRLIKAFRKITGVTPRAYRLSQ